MVHWTGLAAGVSEMRVARQRLIILTWAVLSWTGVYDAECSSPESGGPGMGKELVDPDVSEGGGKGRELDQGCVSRAS